MFWPLVISAGVVLAGIHPCLRWFRRQRWTSPNYEGRAIPLGLGLLLAFALVAGLGLAVAMGRTAALPATLTCTSLLAVAALGWWDDRRGERHIKGLRGHLRALLAGRVTTGLLKLMGGGLLAAAMGVFVALEAGGAMSWRALPNALVIALATNIINALDLRPGRAIKGFGLGLALVWLGGGWLYLPVAPLALAALALLPWDLAGMVMLGDTGSNLLGFGLGLTAAATLPWRSLLSALVLLAALQIVVERSSLTRWIERLRPLRAVDEWGRASARRWLSWRT